MVVSTRFGLVGAIALLVPWSALADPAALASSAQAAPPSTVPPPLPEPAPPPLPPALPPPLPPFVAPAPAPIPGVLGARRVTTAGLYTMAGGASLLFTGGLLAGSAQTCSDGCFEPGAGVWAGLGLAVLGIHGVGVGVCLSVAGAAAEDAALKRAGVPRVAVVPTGRGVAVAGRF